MKIRRNKANQEISKKNLIDKEIPPYHKESGNPGQEYFQYT